MMELPKLGKIRGGRPVTMQFGGLNRMVTSSPSEPGEMFNMSVDDLPTLKPRDSRSVLSTHASALNSIFAGPVMCYVEGTSFYYNGVSKGTVTAGIKTMLDFNGKIVIFPDRKYYDYGTNIFGNLGAGTYPEAGSCPEIDYACLHENRIFGVKGDAIYACASGNCLDWTTFIDADGNMSEVGAWASDTGTKGSFTGIVSYQGHVVMFKADLTFELYGELPGNFRWIQIAEQGCLTQHSIAEVGNVLYFLGRGNVLRYSGGQFEPVSSMLNESTIVTGASGFDDRHYFISMQTGTSEHKLYVLDTHTRSWAQQDDVKITQFTRLDGYTYALDFDNKRILKFSDGTETVSWSFTTGEITDGMHEHKRNYRIIFRAEMEPGSSMSVFVKSDDNAYVRVGSYGYTGQQVFVVPALPYRAERFRVRFAGSGVIRFYSLERRVTVGSEV